MIFFWLSFLGSFLLYLKTLYPTVGPGDGGELITAAYTLGIAHPPGYPLYCLLGKLFSLLPVGNIAYRLNLMSAVFASLTVGIVYLLAEEFLSRFGESPGRKTLAFLTALLFAVSKDFWSQSLSAEVYTLNLVFLTLILWLLLRWDRSRRRDLLFLAAFLTGVGLTNHHTLLMVIPPFFLLAASKDPAFFRDRRALFLSLLLFFLPLLLYLYLPLRAGSSFVWDAGGWKGSLYHILRRQYYEAPSLAPRDLAIYRLQLLGFLKVLGEQVPWFLWGAVLWGGIRVFWKDGALSFLFGVLLIETLFLLQCANSEPTALSMYQLRPFFIPQTLLVSLLIGLSFQDLLSALRKSRLLSRLAVFFFACSVGISLVSSYAFNDRSWRTLFYDYGRDLLRSLPPRACFVVSGDEANFISYYLNFVEGRRKDLAIFSTEKAVFPTIDEASFESWQTLKASSRPALYTNSNTLRITKGGVFVQEGLMGRLVRGKETVKARNLWPLYRAEIAPYIEKGELLERMVAAEYLYARIRSFLQEGRREEAASELRRLSKACGDIDDLHTLLAYFCLEKGWGEEAKKEFETALALNATSSEARKGLGIALGLLGDHRRSAQLLREVFERRPRDSELSFNLGVSLGNLGYFSEALEWFRYTASLEPDHPDVRGAIKHTKELLQKGL